MRAGGSGVREGFFAGAVAARGGWAGGEARRMAAVRGRVDVVHEVEAAIAVAVVVQPFPRAMLVHLGLVGVRRLSSQVFPSAINVEV